MERTYIQLICEFTSLLVVLTKLSKHVTSRGVYVINNPDLIFEKTWKPDVWKIFVSPFIKEKGHKGTWAILYPIAYPCPCGGWLVIRSYEIFDRKNETVSRGDLLTPLFLIFINSWGFIRWFGIIYPQTTFIAHHVKKGGFANGWFCSLTLNNVKHVLGPQEDFLNIKHLEMKWFLNSEDDHDWHHILDQGEIPNVWQQGSFEFLLQCLLTLFQPFPGGRGGHISPHSPLPVLVGNNWVCIG